jgi:protein TonB
MQSRLIHRVNPIYPKEARDEHITGVVVLTVTVNEEGVVTDIVDAGGPPELVSAAIEAVRQWRYSPTLLDGVPVPVVAEVRISFALG